jgi:hypothetical protein
LLRDLLDHVLMGNRPADNVNAMENSRTRSHKRALTFFVAVLLAWNSYTCRDYQRYRQLETYRMMSLITGEVDRSIDRIPPAQRASAVQQIINRHAKNGKDAWGNPILFYEQQKMNSYHYAIVSLGSDGRADFDGSAQYFVVSRKSIHNTPSSDIVFRDGLPITEAGK